MKKFLHIFFICIVAATALALTGGSGCKNQPTQGGGGGNDTTSHNFTWTVDTLGTQTSYLTDVCIINDTDVWAVGEIHNDSTDRYDSIGFYLPNSKYDSAGHYLPFFNAARWDGTQWHYLRIYTDAVAEANASDEPLRAVFAFSPNDIWLGSEDPYHGGEESKYWTRYSIKTNGYMNKIWGTSDLNMFFGYQKGTILNERETIFNPITLNNTDDVQDIYGYTDGNGQPQEMLALTSNPSGSGGTPLLTTIYQYMPGTGWRSVNVKDLPWNMSGVWFMPGGPYYCVGGNVEKINSLNDTGWQLLTPPESVANYFATAIRGNGANDIVIVGQKGGISHWNGISWREYTGIGNSLNDLMSSVAMKGDFVVAVGERYNNGVYRQGVVYMGRRNV